MLKRHVRLPAHTRLVRAQTIITPCFVLKRAANYLPHSRVGVVVSRKVAKQAVVRNRLKRLLITAIQEMNAMNTPGYDMLFILRQQAVTAGEDAFLHTLRTTLKQFV